MRAAKFILWSVVSLLTILALTLAWLWTADLGVFKPQIEAWVSEATGREFTIDGALNVDLAGNTVVVARDIRFQNAPWADEPEMVEAGYLEVQLDLWSLFSDDIVIESVVIHDVVARLERRADHEPNWVLPTTAAAAEPEAGAAGPTIIVKLVDIDRVNVVLDSYARDRVLDLRIASLDQVQRDDEFLEFDMLASLNDSDILLRGEVGTLPALLAGQDIHYEVEGRLHTFTIESSGWIDDVNDLRRPEFRIKADSPNIDDLTRLLGVGEDAEGDIKLTGSLLQKNDDQLELSVKGNIARIEIEVAGAFSDLMNMQQAEIDALVSGPDLGRLLRLAGIHGIREAPFMIDIDVERNGPELRITDARMVFASAEFDASAELPHFPSVDGASISVRIAGPDMEQFRYITGLPGKATGTFNIDFDLAAVATGEERFDLDVATSFGSITADGTLSAAADFVGSTITATVQGNSLRELGEAWGIENLPDEAFRVAANAELTPGAVRLGQPLQLTIGENTAAVGGLVAFESGLAGSELDFSMGGPSLKTALSDLSPVEIIPDEAFAAAGNLDVRADGYYLSGVSGTLGSTGFGVDEAFLPAGSLAGANIDFSVAGPDLQEVVSYFGEFGVRPGPFDLHGNASLLSDSLRLQDVVLSRDADEVSLDLELGLPVSRRWANFEIRADAANMRNVFRHFKSYEARQTPFFVDLRGELRSTEIRFEKLNVGIGDGRLNARGDVNFGEGRSSSKLRLSGDIPSLADLGSFDGRQFRDQAIKWDTRIEGSDGVLSIDDLNLTLGESDVSGSVRFVRGDRPSLDVDIRSDSIVFGPLLEQRDVEHPAEPNFPDGRLIPDIAVPFEQLQAFDASVKLLVDEFKRDKLSISRVDLAVDLKEGVLDVQHASFDGFTGWIKGRATLDPAAGAGDLSLELVARDYSAVDRGEDTVQGDLDISLRSRGTDLRSLAGNVNGMILVATTGGRLPNTMALQAIYGDMLTEILNVINPFYKASRYTDIECIVLAAGLTDGKLASAPGSYVGTDKIRLSLKSNIDLKTEKIGIEVKMRPKNGLKISSGELLNPYVKIVGSLAAPRLAVDETGVLISGGAAAATGGLSILAGVAWDRLSRAKDPCSATAEAGREALQERFPSLGDQPAESSTYSRID